jgi:uncharacterized repeat protein (TIGR01451 family)
VEWLEPRTLLSTFTVVNTNDSGTGSLAQAILDANAHANVGGAPDDIAFNIPGGGVQRVTLQNDLPTLTDAVVMNGYTQPGSSPNTNPIDQPDNAVLDVVIDGSKIPDGRGLVVGTGAAGSTIEGLVIDGFNTIQQAALYLNGGGNHVVGNYIGVDPTGLVASANNSNNTGVEVTGPNNVIGGTSPADRNVISGNRGVAVDVTGSSATKTLIEGNYIGVTADGNSGFPLAFLEEGVVVSFADAATIGGTVAGARNVIAGGNAIDLNFATNTTIQGNYIGTDRTGTVPVSSLQAINIRASTNTQIGGSTAGAGNVIGGKAPGAVTQVGIAFVGSNKTTTIQGNFIGTDPSGTHDIGPFSYGISEAGSPGTTIGGTGPGEGNVIANDAFGGAGSSIFVGDDVLIEGNSFYGNDGPAIQGSAIVPPFLTGATSTTITGHINGNPGSTYRVEYYATPNTGGASNKQGKTLLGFQSGLVADASGNVPLSFNPTGGVPAGEFITAMAIKDGAATSGFSSGILPSGTTTSADMGVGVGVAPNPVAAGSDLTFTITVTNGGPNAATQAAMATAVPIGTTFVSLVSPAGWAANTPAVGGTGPISASIASLTSGGQAVFTLIVRVAPTSAAGSTIALSSTVSTSANDPNPGNNSNGTSATVSSTLVATRTSLLSSASPAAFGQLVTLTATVTGATGGTPAGNVTFLDGTTPIKTVALDQHGHATFSISSLGAGSHTITAVYGGNGTLAGSQSSINQVVQPASVVGPGPQVSLVQRFGVHMHPTVLVLTFNMGLDPTSATNLENYELAGPGGQRIKFKSASYDSIAHTVTLSPTELVNVHRSYQLVVKGGAPNGVCGVDHAYLDGAGDGQPGTDFVTTLTWKNAVLSPKNTNLLDKWVYGQKHPRQR